MSADGNAAAAAALVSGLVHGGVAHAVLSPGARNTPLTLAFADRDDVAVTSVLDERAAGFFALGLARSSRRAVALVCTSGSAATHYLPAVVEAEASRVPLVLLSADRPAELHGCGAPQTMDQRRLFGAFVRASRDLPAPIPSVGLGHFVTAGAQAVSQATGAPMGPVHLNCAFREPLWAPGAVAPAVTAAPAREVAGRSLDAAALHRIATRLLAARRGVIVCGPYAADAEGFAAAVRALAHRLHWPLLVSAGSGARFGDAAAEVVSTYDVFLRGPLSRRLEADCVLRFGHLPTSAALSAWLARQRGTILVSADGARHDPAHRAALWVDAPATSLVEALLDALGVDRAPAPAAADADLSVAPPRVGPAGPSSSRLGRGAGASQNPVHISRRAHLDSLETRSQPDPWAARWRAAEATTRSLLTAHCARPDWEGAIARRVVDAVPHGGALHLANSMPIRAVGALCPPDGRHRTTYVSRGVNGIDGTLSTAAGEAVGGGRPVTALVGDLAFLHDLGGLLVAAPAPVTFVVVDNGGGGIFDFLPIAAHGRHFETLFRTPQTVDIEHLCAGAGVRYRAVQIGPALTAAVAAEHERARASVIHVAVDPAVNLARHQALWAEVDDAMGALP